jgi:hypothetical protein
MADQISEYMTNDPYAPLVPKPELQQYDNYQIHDLYCVDIVYTNSYIGSISNNTIHPPNLFRSWIAVEVYRNPRQFDYLPYTDFNLIAQTYT